MDGVAQNGSGSLAASARVIVEGTAPVNSGGEQSIVLDESNTDDTSVFGAGFQSEAWLGGKAGPTEAITLNLYGRIRLRDTVNSQWIESEFVLIKSVVLAAGADFTMTRIQLSDGILWPNQFRLTWLSAAEAPDAGSKVALVLG